MMFCKGVMGMPDYKEMYLKMVRASERAINILIEAQRECEELYISGQERQRAGEGERVAKPLAPESQWPAAYRVPRKNRGFLRGSPSCGVGPPFGPTQTGGLPLKRVFGYFLHDQKLTPRRASPEGRALLII